jgi:hypothetical protein
MNSTKKFKIYDFHCLSGCLDHCECDDIPGVLCVGFHKYVAECPSCKLRSEEGELVDVMLSWNLARRKANGIH